jgi:hypothetical protein
MPLMVWQFELLPGAQTVTLVKASLIAGEFMGGPAVGPVFTVMV